jgi:hypothetical protein
MIDFEYKEIVRASMGTRKMIIIGYIEKCRQGYFFRPKGESHINLKRTKRFKTPSQVRTFIKGNLKCV